MNLRKIFKGVDKVNVLVTGGTGFIGSHTVVELINAGHNVVIVDNLVNSSINVIDRIKSITNSVVKFYNVDLRDRDGLEDVFRRHNFDSCIHFAALKAVGESVYMPLEYYDNNITGTLILLDLMKKYSCKRIIFSSSATVYGTPNKIPISEECPLGKCSNPYGRTKMMLEEILTDLYIADKKNKVKNPWKMVFLRYFNPIGAHSSGLIGESPKGIPNNLMPYITQVALGKLDKLHVYGNDYNTNDGTGVRDYIHVVDLALGHIKALENIDSFCKIKIYNLGTGIGYSVLDVIKAFESVTNIKIPYIIDERRQGDVAECYSDPSKAYEELGWKSKYDILDMCRDSWRWQINNPNGI